MVNNKDVMFGSVVGVWWPETLNLVDVFCWLCMVVRLIFLNLVWRLFLFCPNNFCKKDGTSQSNWEAFFPRPQVLKVNMNQNQYSHQKRDMYRKTTLKATGLSVSLLTSSYSHHSPLKRFIDATSHALTSHTFQPATLDRGLFSLLVEVRWFQSNHAFRRSQFEHLKNSDNKSTISILHSVSILLNSRASFYTPLQKNKSQSIFPKLIQSPGAPPWTKIGKDGAIKHAIQSRLSCPRCRVNLHGSLGWLVVVVVWHVF